jgi:NAD(P)H-hydrate epimerase
MKILTAAQMQRIDRLTTERYGVPSLTLMENAARGVVEFLGERFAPLGQQRIVILCGRGNNGGDGFVCWAIKG